MVANGTIANKLLVNKSIFFFDDGDGIYNHEQIIKDENCCIAERDGSDIKLTTVSTSGQVRTFIVSLDKINFKILPDSKSIASQQITIESTDLWFGDDKDPFFFTEKVESCDVQITQEQAEAFLVIISDSRR